MSRKVSRKVAPTREALSLIKYLRGLEEDLMEGKLTPIELTHHNSRRPVSGVREGEANLTLRFVLVRPGALTLDAKFSKSGYPDGKHPSGG